MIQLRDVRKSFGAHEVISNLSFDVNKGEVLCLIGASCSGKSTLLQCINGLYSIEGGSILVDGINVHDRKTNLNALRRKLGIVFQQYNAFPHLTALENVALAPRIVGGLTRRAAGELAHKHLIHVGLGDKANEMPS